MDTVEEDACGGEKPANAKRISSPDDNNPGAIATAPTRTPFSSLTQVDREQAIACLIQQQAHRMFQRGRAYNVEGNEFEEDEDASVFRRTSDSGHARANEGDLIEGGEVEDYDQEEEDEEEGEEDMDDQVYEEDEEEGDMDGEEDEDNNLTEEGDPVDYEDNEDYARLLLHAERGLVVRLRNTLNALGEWWVENSEESEDDSQDLQDIDPDEYSYEELLALGEVVGIENRGLSAEIIASLPSVNYKAQDTEDGNADQCVICRVEFEDGESLMMLPCNHSYHSECINKWLQINKMCPVCSTEVSSTSNNKRD